MKRIAIALICLFAVSAHAATFTVINTNDTGAGSLRIAISNANANAGSHLIDFAITPLDGTVKTITPVTSLPGMSKSVTIDGYTQTNSSPNTLANDDNAILLIELNGTTAGGNGLNIAVSNCVVRGLVINRFPGNGISINSSDARNVVIEGNFIGTDPSGTIKHANGQGIFVGGPDALIGGTTPTARNLISGNTGFGVGTGGLSTTNAVIQGNFIGTDLHGTTALGNGSIGIFIGTAFDNVIGGAADGAGNVISGNGAQGVNITTSFNLIQGNWIGTDMTGTLNLSNHTEGVIIGSGGVGNQIGGAAGNVIGFNGSFGVSIQPTSPVASNHLISANSIFANKLIGINLGNFNDPVSGVSTNDLADTDDGSNHQQNFPVLTAATSTVNSVTIAGLLDSTPSTNFTLEFFANPTCDPSGFGEGETFLGATNVTTGANHTNNFTVTFPVAVPNGHFITATATDPNGNTSEFSQCFTNQGTAVAATFLGPCPYLSFGDSPFNGVVCAPFYLENFEDNSLNVTGVIASAGSPTGPGGLTDSVDADDGVIDGSGTLGQSFFSGSGAAGITFTFSAAQLGTFPTHVGIVWTDGAGDTSFEAFDQNGLSLGTNGPVAIADGSFSGTTSEDRFFGVIRPGGISAIKISNTSGGIEVDHLQYGICGALPELVCSLVPATATNQVGSLHTVTATITASNSPVAGTLVRFDIIAGPNQGVTGTATTDTNGLASFSYTGAGGVGTDTIRASGSCRPFLGTASEVWIVTCPTITLAPASPLPNGTVGVAYNQTITATGSTAIPISFTNSVGALPSGLALSSAGTLSGMPTTQGTSGFTVTATDTNNCTGSRGYTLTIDAVAQPCTITCPSDIVTNTAPGLCGATVTFNVGSSGSCPTIVATPASGSFFNKGTNTVTVTTNDLTACTFNVTVNDNEPPSLTCPATIITNVPAGVTNAIVNFNLTAADDNCSGGSLLINPPSGTAFPLGTNTVVVSMSDAAGNTNGCSFKVIVQELPPETHDLALIKLKAPKNINLQGAEPSLTKFVKVTLQNRSPHDEVITNFNGLVTLVAQSLSNVCPNAQVVLHPGPPNNPKTLKPKQKMTVTFDVTWTCANDPLKGEGHEDFRYLATVHHEAIDGQPDTHPEDDGCPRAALPGGTDSNPDPSKPLKDTGCAGGVDVKTDVFLKQ